MKHGQDAITSRATPESKLIVTQSPFDAFVRKYGTIPRRGVFGYFVHELGRRIVGGDYPVGATLPNEPDLVEQFGISRTVIREAMKCLAGKGLVEIKTRGLLAQVKLSIGGQTITSIITAEAVEEMGLKVGDTAAALIKSTEVMIAMD